jgi:ribonucleoside-triphosphate reductase
VYNRTYSRKKPDGTNETWPETVARVVHGNLALVYGDDQEKWSPAIQAEGAQLIQHISEFKILPAGRHLWASGVKGRQYLMNCWTSGWGETLSDHFEFTFMRLMEGGGVGANYSSDYLIPYGLPRRALEVHIVCDPDHADYQEMLDAGLLSTEYTSDWEGAFEVEDSREGWSSALVDLIDTFMSVDEVKHSKRVYDVTNVRPKGARLKTFGGTASGPAPFGRMMLEVARVLCYARARGAVFPQYAAHPDKDAKGAAQFITPIEAMEIDHAIAECVVSGGVRRSARMSMVRWDDPWALDFLRCKTDTGKHWTTNISLEIDDRFIAEVQDFYDQTKVTIIPSRAIDIHQAAIESMLTNGEPGFFNVDLANEGELKGIYTTNPCGEITLEEWEACNLGHVNLDAFAPKEQGESDDWDGIYEAHRLMTRFLIRATYADVQDPKSREVVDRNRRIGVGHFGVQGYLTKRGIRYSEAPKTRFGGDLAIMRAWVDSTARDYAFELRIPTPIKTTTVAPTGSIAKLPGATEGIHPIYARHFIRRIRFNVTDDDQWAQVLGYEDMGYRTEVDIYDQSGNTVVVEIPTKELLVEQVEALGFDPSIVESADEISLGDMLAFQAMYQKHYSNNAVSFTVNVPEGAYSTGSAGVVIASYLPALKGTTIMPDGTRPQAPYERITEEQYESFLVKSVADSIDDECATGACPIR